MKSKSQFGRPQIKIDWTEFDKLCAMHCTLIEISEWFKCSEDTIERIVKREKKMTFAEYLKRKSSMGKISLRRQMYQTAMGIGKGATTMQIWLSKNYLDYSDKLEKRIDDVTDPSKKILTVKTDPAEVKAVLEKLRSEY